MNHRHAITMALLPVFLVVIAACGQGQPSGKATPMVSPTTGTPANQPTSESGETLYRANCQTCHGGATGGSMMDIPPPHNANGHTWHHSDCQLVQTVLNGSGEMGQMMRRMMNVPEGTPQMPAWKGILSEEDVTAILAYIKTWWTPEQRQWQANTTQQAC